MKGLQRAGKNFKQKARKLQRKIDRKALKAEERPQKLSVERRVITMALPYLYAIAD